MKQVGMLGGPPLYLEAVAAELRAQGVEVVTDDAFSDPVDVLEAADVVLVYCETEADWRHLETLDHSRAVAVLPDLRLEDLIRALAAGASATHLLTSSEIIVETVQAAATGEALLPIGLVQRIARRAVAGSEPADLSAIDQILIAALADDLTVPQMARDLNYSNRTIRRKLQSLYVRLDVATKQQAVQRCKKIEAARRRDPDAHG